MFLQVGDAIDDGVRRSLTKSGAALTVLMFAYMLVFVSATNALFLEFLPSEAQDSGQFGPTLPVPPAVAGGIVVLGILFGVVLCLIATRALNREHSELSSLPAELFTRRTAGRPSRPSGRTSPSSWQS